MRTVLTGENCEQTYSHGSSFLIGAYYQVLRFDSAPLRISRIRRICATLVPKLQHVESYGPMIMRDSLCKIRRHRFENI